MRTTPSEYQRRKKIIIKHSYFISRNGHARHANRRTARVTLRIRLYIGENVLFEYNHFRRVNLTIMIH